MEKTHQPHQEHQTHQKKRFSEEETLDRVEKKIDHNMEKIMNHWFAHKFLDLKIVKDILGAHIVNEANHKVQPHINIIFIIVGWLSLITWVAGILFFLFRDLSNLGFMFSLGFGIGVRVLIYVLLAILFSLLSVFIWIGLLRYKKRLMSLAILGFAVSVFSFIVSLMPMGLYSYSSYGSFWSGFFNLLIAFVLLVLILKNEHMFKN